VLYKHIEVISHNRDKQTKKNVLPNTLYLQTGKVFMHTIEKAKFYKEPCAQGFYTTSRFRELGSSAAIAYR